MRASSWLQWFNTANRKWLFTATVKSSMEVQTSLTPSFHPFCSSLFSFSFPSPPPCSLVCKYWWRILAAIVAVLWFLLFSFSLSKHKTLHWCAFSFVSSPSLSLLLLLMWMLCLFRGAFGICSSLACQQLEGVCTIEWLFCWVFFNSPAECFGLF